MKLGSVKERCQVLINAPICPFALDSMSMRSSDRPIDLYPSLSMALYYSERRLCLIVHEDCKWVGSRTR